MVLINSKNVGWNSLQSFNYVKNGTKAILTRWDNYQYTYNLSKPYNVSSMVLDKSGSVMWAGVGLMGTTFTEDGNYMLTPNRVSTQINQFQLMTQYDVTSLNKTIEINKTGFPALTIGQECVNYDFITDTLILANFNGGNVSIYRGLNTTFNQISTPSTPDAFDWNTNLFGYFPLNESTATIAVNAANVTTKMQNLTSGSYKLQSVDTSGFKANSRKMTTYGYLVDLDSTEGLWTSTPFSLSGVTAMTLSTWYKPQTITGTYQNISAIFGAYRSASPYEGFVSLGTGTDGKMDLTIYNSTTTKGDIYSAQNVLFPDNKDQWNHIVLSINSTAVFVYLNGNLIHNGTHAPLMWGNSVIGLGLLDIDPPASRGNTTFDEFYVWKNRTLNSTEVTSLYASGFGLDYQTQPTEFISSLGFISQTPSNNTQYATSSLIYNLTINNTGTYTGNTICNLNISGVIKDSISTSGNSTLFYSTDINTDEGTIDYFWQCSNAFDSLNSPTTRIFIDSINPTISTSMITNRIYYAGGLLVENFTFYDNQILYKYNFTIGNTYSLQNSTLGTANSITTATNINLGGQALNENALRVLVCDGHTASELTSDYTISTGIFGETLSIKADKKEIKVKEKEATFADEWETKKEKDRITFKYTPAKVKDEYTFIIDTTTEFDILTRPDLKYKQWIVTSDNKWIDFVPRDEPEFTIDIKKLTDRQAEVRIGNLRDSSSIQFESIGELNCVQQNYTFYNLNATPVWTTSETETHTQTQMLYLNKTALQTTTALFYFNTTNITSIIKTNTTTLDIYNATFITPLLPTSAIPISWNFTWYGEINNVSASSNRTQIVSNLIISNCSSPTEANSTSKTYFFYGSDALTKVIANATAVFNVWNGDRTLTEHTFSLVWKGGNNATICLRSDNNEGLNYDLSMIVAAAGYATSTVAEFNGTLSLTPTIQNVYLISAASSFVLKVIDQLSDALAGYAVSQYEYDVSTDTENFVSSLTTDINGNSLFYYTPTKQYRFNITNTVGTNVLDTGRMYIIANPTTVRVNLALTDFTTPNLAAWNLRTTLYNISNTIYLNWTTLSGTLGTICLNVTHINATKSSALYGACSSASYGSLSYTHDKTEGTINAVAWVKGSTYVTNILNLLLSGFLKVWQYMGVSSMIIYIIFIIIAIGISITRVTAMPFALGGAHLISWWMGLIPGTWGFTVVVLCALIAIMIRVKD